MALAKPLRWCQRVVFNLQDWRGDLATLQK
jgi:hypothetical protein